MKKFFLLIALLALALLANTLTQYHMFSLFQALFSIPLMIMLINPFPVVLALCTWIVLELFSSLPSGSILLMFAIPYLVLFFWKSITPDFSLKSLLGITAIIALQSITLLCILALMNPQTALQIPVLLMFAQLLITSLGTFVLSFVYREYSARL